MKTFKGLVLFDAYPDHPPWDPPVVFPGSKHLTASFSPAPNHLIMLGACAYKVTGNVNFFSARPPDICRKHLPGAQAFQQDNLLLTPALPGEMVRIGIE